MKAREIRALLKDELHDKLQGLQKQLMELQFKRKTGIEKPHQFKLIKKDISRILTVLREKKK